MTHKNFDGVVPQPGPLDARDQALLDTRAAMLDDVRTHIEAVHLKAALARGDGARAGGERAT